jgi:hypothetical protein
LHNSISEDRLLDTKTPVLLIYTYLSGI